VKRLAVFGLVAAERGRQEAGFGNTGRDLSGQTMDPHQKLAVLVEEVGEVSQELNDATEGGRPVWTDHLRAELVQVAACAVAWLESMDGP